MLWKGYPQPWRGWLTAVTVLIFALIAVQFATGGSWALFGVILALIVIQYGLSRYARGRS